MYKIRKTVNLFAFIVLWLGLLMPLTIGVQTVEAQYTADGQGFPLASPISILSPSNTTYSSSSLTLMVTSKFLLDSKYATLSYSVDGKENASMPVSATFFPIETLITYANGTTKKGISIFSYYIITGHIALPELPEGSHNITVYARYQANNIVGLDSSTVYFTVNSGASTTTSNMSAQNSLDAETPSNMSSLSVENTLVTVASIVAVVLVGTVSLCHFKIHNKIE